MFNLCTMYTATDIKKIVGEHASKMVQTGMVVGLGTGSTAYWFIKALGDRIKNESLVFTGVPTSKSTANLCTELGIPLLTLNEVVSIDIDIDGADEIDPHFNLIKGGGGALLQEKMVAAASKQFIVIGDNHKLVKKLGTFPLPVEVVQDGWKQVQRMIDTTYQVHSILRLNAGAPFITDHGHYILDCYFKQITEPDQLCIQLNNVPGVVENGLFIKMATKAIIGMPDGSITEMEPGK
jgi:ribose 5-phosphate isomerase A